MLTASPVASRCCAVGSPATTSPVLTPIRLPMRTPYSRSSSSFSRSSAPTHARRRRGRRAPRRPRGPREAEDRHHRVADELLDRAAVALDRSVTVAKYRVLDLVDGLRIHALAEGRAVLEVGEDDGHDLADLPGRSGWTGAAGTGVAGALGTDSRTPPASPRQLPAEARYRRSRTSGSAPGSPRRRTGTPRWSRRSSPPESPARSRNSAQAETRRVLLAAGPAGNGVHSADSLADVALVNAETPPESVTRGRLDLHHEHGQAGIGRRPVHAHRDAVGVAVFGREHGLGSGRPPWRGTVPSRGASSRPARRAAISTRGRRPTCRRSLWPADAGHARHLPDVRAATSASERPARDARRHVSRPRVICANVRPSPSVGTNTGS